MKLREVVPTNYHSEIYPRVCPIPDSIHKFDNEKLVLIDVFDFWDGELSGMLKQDNQTCYFQVCDGTSWYGYGDNIPDFKENFYRRFVILEQNKESLKLQEVWELALKKDKGIYKVNNTKPFKSDETKSAQENFYMSLLDCNVIGWFER